VFILAGFIGLPVVATNESVQMWAKHTGARVLARAVGLISLCTTVVTRQTLPRADRRSAAERAGSRLTVTYAGREVSTAASRIGAAVMAAASTVFWGAAVCSTLVASGSTDGMVLLKIVASGVALACSTFLVVCLAFLEGVGEKTKVEDHSSIPTTSHCVSWIRGAIRRQQAQLCPSTASNLRGVGVWWCLHLAVLSLVNATVILAAAFEGYVYSIMLIQVLLACNAVSATYALGQLPSVTLALENPVMMLFKEHWALVPGGLQRQVTRVACASVSACAPSCAPRGELTLPL